MSVLDHTFDLQLAIWGYHLEGSDVTEFSALVAEGKSLNERAWDHTRRGLLGSTISHTPGDAPHRVPDSWALPWLTEHILRGHEEYVPCH